MDLQSFHCKTVNKMITPWDCVRRQKAQANKFCFGGSCAKGKVARKAVELGSAVDLPDVEPAAPAESAKPPAPAEPPPQRVSPSGRVSCQECGSCGRHRSHCSKYRGKAKSLPVLHRPIDPAQLTDEELVACTREARERATRITEELDARVRLLRGEA